MTTNKLSFFMAIATLGSVSFTYCVNPKSIHSQELPLIITQNVSQNFAQNGQGKFLLKSRPSQNISSATVTINNTGKAEISFRLQNGNLTRFGGVVVNQTNNQIVINLTNSGMANATGKITINYNRSELNSIVGNGSLDGQTMSIDFKSNIKPPQKEDLRMNLVQNGQGVFSLQGRPNSNIKVASVTIKSNGKVQIALRLANGNMVSFEGKQIKKDAYSIIISLTNSGMANATGIINVEYGANNSINSMFGDGTLDGQQFLINFNN